MKEREQNLLIAASEVVGDFKSFGPVLQKSRKEDYGPESSIGNLGDSLLEYESEEFTCETDEKTHLENGKVEFAKDTSKSVAANVDLLTSYNRSMAVALERAENGSQAENLYFIEKLRKSAKRLGYELEKENDNVVFASDRKKIKESEVLESIKLCIDALDLDGLAKLYNSLYDDENITGDDIIPFGEEKC